MLEISTLKKGDAFEGKSLEIIRKVIETEQLGLSDKYIRIYTRKEKGYYSPLRKKDIFFDLTIEVWPPGSKKYVMLYIIECKNYSKRVPVDDIEEFHHKIQQVSGVNVKGIFISNSPIQEGGLNIADSVGMMVIQGESSNNYEIILHKTNKDLQSLLIPLVSETKDKSLFNATLRQTEKTIDKAISEIFINDIENSHVSYNIDKLSKEHIEEIANIEIEEVYPNSLEKSFPLSVHKLRHYIEEHEKILIFEFDSSKELLGFCDISAKQIGINSSIIDTKRELFVLAHEYGHYVLHQRLTIGQNAYDNFKDSEYNFKTDKHELENAKNWIEWQANYFAACLLLPKDSLLFRLAKKQNRMKLRVNKIYLNDQQSNHKEFQEIISELSYFFSVSKTTIIYRLKELNWIIEKSNIKSIRQIIKEYRSDLYV